MPINRLLIENVRNLQKVELRAHPKLNLFFGDNGAGKTSILEAINLVSVGRSFRHHRAKPLIRNACHELTVYAEIEDQSRNHHRLGITKTRAANTLIKVDGNPVYSAASLAEHLPVLNLNAQSFELIEGPPKPRRQLLDWLTFHVEPLFLSDWKSLQHCLKQRNSLLRHDKILGSELDSWDIQLSELADKIDQYRSRVFTTLMNEFGNFQQSLPGLGNIEIEYKKGWLREHSYTEVLAAQRQSDHQRGFTQSGPHRADLAIKIDKRVASEVLSRGQTKIVVTALVVALAKAFSNQCDKDSVFLIDDLPAELDTQHRQQVGGWLGELKTQLFVTAVDKAPLYDMWPPGISRQSTMFHVKQGQVITDLQNEQPRGLSRPKGQVT